MSMLAAEDGSMMTAPVKIYGEYKKRDLPLSVLAKR